LTSAARARAGGFPSLLFSLGFRFGDSFALPLKHQFTLEAGDSADDGEHQVTGRCAGIAEIQDAEVGPLAFTRSAISSKCRVERASGRGTIVR
jgi:hypothetical protein